MVFRSSILIVALCGFYFLRTFTQTPPSSGKEGLVLQGIMETIKYVHFSPKEVNDDFSTNVYKTYLERLDAQKRFLTQQDIDKLKQYELTVDDQVKATTFDFFNASLPMLDNGIKKVRTYFNEAIDAPMNFNKGDQMEMDAEKRVYAKNDSELKSQWKSLIQFEVMTKWLQNIKDQEGKEVKTDLKTDEELKQSAVKDVKKKFNDWFDRLSKLRRSDRMEMYLGTITNYFDPHTDYFSPREKQDFDINMGGKLEGIGARLTSEGDYTKVYSIIVGGPAWKTKKLDENDIILKVTQKGQEPVDIAGMRSDDVVQLVRGKKGTTVILTVRKKDNTVVDVAIERDEVQLDDTFAKSVILDLPGKIQNIGYINLPKFYSEFEDGGNSCARDVAEEIKKLKSQNVNGIILDLRDNSGGSLNDVVDMSGLFIEEGPIVQVKGRETKPMLHVDKDKSVLYTGPLIIMVNQMSASASEIIAAAMQDYNRAIIVGSNSTFGKGTVQRFYDLDRGVRGYDEFKPLGAVKMTTQKFYRVNGGSTQLKGVIPDIILPDTYHFIKIGEKEYDNPLEWTEIAPVPFAQHVVMIENKAKIVENSKNRVAQHKDFQLVMQSAEMVKKNRELTKYPLKINEYKEMMDKRDLENKKYDKLMKNDIAGMEVRNLPVDLPKIKMDEATVAKNSEFIKELKKDIYLEETMYILKDMINLEKSFVALQQKIDKP